MDGGRHLQATATDAHRIQQPVGSIPARAGEPTAWNAMVRWPSVYPRACGGTAENHPAVSLWEGLSPRVRGNLVAIVGIHTSTRSIPARAGEPGECRRSPRARRVYPRACGGTAEARRRDQISEGLSPRVRGNLIARVPCSASKRSIPARAGEPRRPGAATRYRRVYPRACGGTSLRGFLAAPANGLSPRVRGNQTCDSRWLRRGGSIPARAGEPRRRRAPAQWAWVYPRACGGTSCCSCPPASAGGLSPRVRGNLNEVWHGASKIGSIPARAGEPAPDLALHAIHGVYPRACGGTSGVTLQ